MNNAEIQIQFPKPGTWQEFTLTAVYQDAEGYTRTARYAPNEIPADHAPAMAAVVSSLVELGEDWQAVQVWARLGDIPSPSSPTDKVSAVLLTVEATGDSGGTKIFTPDQYPQFVLTDSGTLSFFNFFTKG